MRVVAIPRDTVFPSTAWYTHNKGARNIWMAHQDRVGHAELLPKWSQGLTAAQSLCWWSCFCRTSCHLLIWVCSYSPFFWFGLSNLMHHSFDRLESSFQDTRLVEFPVLGLRGQGFGIKKKKNTWCVFQPLSILALWFHICYLTFWVS